MTSDANPLIRRHKGYNRDRRWFIDLLHVLVLISSLFLVIFISIDTFKNIAFYNQPKFMKVQFWICILFLFDFFLEWILARKKWHYLATHFLFFVVSIPYLSIIDHFGWSFSPLVAYLLRFVPLVRGGYALAIVVGWFTYNRATSLFLTYLCTLLATIYFGSLVFFVFEHNVNPLVKDYYSALWWAFMDVTTVGSNIIAVTPVGKVLSVVLAALGMMMFPIFTVYVTNIIKTRNQESSMGVLPDTILPISMSGKSHDGPADAAASASLASGAPASVHTGTGNQDTSPAQPAPQAENGE